MGHIYFVRHGESVWNTQNKICGRTDIPLTETGRNQARLVGAKILEQNLTIDEIRYSPLIRAKETALIIEKITGIPAIEEPGLMEQNFGYFESTARDGEEFRKAKAEFLCRYGTGESMFQMAQRIYNFLDLMKTETRDKTIMLVAHNGISRIVNSYFYEMTNQEFADFGVKNCSIVRYDFDGEKV